MPTACFALLFPTLTAVSGGSIHSGLPARSSTDRQEPAPTEPAPSFEPSERAAKAIGEAESLLPGDAGVVTYDELRDLLVWREARSPSGQETLLELVKVRVVEKLGQQAKIEITDDALGARFREIDEAARAENPGGIAAIMKAQGISRDEFEEYLRLGMIHEELARRALDLPKGQSPSSDQQTLWLEGVLGERDYEEKSYPYEGGVVATSGDLTISRDEFAEQLLKTQSDDDVRYLSYLVLLERAILARMPEIDDAGVEGALDRELARRSEAASNNPQFQGATYEQVLNARGLSLEAVRRDPAIRAAALAHEAIDRKHTDEDLRRIYMDERDLFDSRFGEAVEVRILFKNASERADDPLRRPFGEVEEELANLKEALSGPEEFLRALQLHSEDATTREREGLLGKLTRVGSSEDLARLREAVFEVVDEAPDGTKGKILGPVRMTNGAVLAMLGERTPAPTWAEMKLNVHQELRRRFMEETLARDEVATFIGRPK